MMNKPTQAGRHALDQARRTTVMNGMMNGADGMTWGMGFVGFLSVLVLILVVAAPIKYVFFR
jgi:hypothetical protein